MIIFLKYLISSPLQDTKPTVTAVSKSAAVAKKTEDDDEDSSDEDDSSSEEDNV